MPDKLGDESSLPDIFSGNDDFAERIEEAVESNDKTVDTSNGKDNGLDKCPSCGSAEVSYSMESHKLKCDYCRFEWSEANADETFGFNSSIKDLRGVTTSSGAKDITDNNDMVTIKCQGCGAEIVINTANATQSRCHWCRQTLSLNTQIPNGAVPDAILPFTLKREEAVENIREFVGKRQFFTTKKFKEEFEPENVIGVFMPYMVVDGSLSTDLRGVGEVETRRYTVTVGTGDDKRTETRYDADVYAVHRNFDYTVDDLITESSSERADLSGKVNTNNVLNAILPFDTKNSVTFNSNYMKGHTSEKRDLNVTDVGSDVTDKFKGIARYQAKEMIRKYDRGVRWEDHSIEVHGTRWVAVYLPVWLYSYHVDKGKGKTFTHYVAVNARNGNTMGSVPVNHFKLSIASFIGGTAAFGISAAVVFGEMLS